MHEKKYISLEDTAHRLNTTPLNILMHIKRGLLAGVEEEGLWKVTCQSLEALMEKTGGKTEDVCASGCAKQHTCGGCS